MVVGKPVRIWAGWDFLLSFWSPFLQEQLGVAHLRIVWLHQAENLRSSVATTLHLIIGSASVFSTHQLCWDLWKDACQDVTTLPSACLQFALLTWTLSRLRWL